MVLKAPEKKDGVEDNTKIAPEKIKTYRDLPPQTPEQAKRTDPVFGELRVEVMD